MDKSDYLDFIWTSSIELFIKFDYINAGQYYLEKYLLLLNYLFKVIISIIL